MKKLLISFLISLTLFLSFVPYFSPVKAQTWYSQNPVEWYLKVYDPEMSPPNEIFGERYTAAQVQWIVWSFLSLPIRAIIVPVVGEDVVLFTFKLFGTGTADLENAKNSVKDITTKVLEGIIEKVYPESTTEESVSNQPFLKLVFDASEREISGIGYVKSLVTKLSPISTVYAQGYGYKGLTWIQHYWQGFRNMAYMILVPIVLIFAFMIMFRVKINPQTVISIQSAIPKVIIAVVLVTFSYAIAGFVVDMMYVISGLFALLVDVAGFTGDNGLALAFRHISGVGVGYDILGNFWIFFMMIAYSICFVIISIISFIFSLIQAVNIFGMLLAIVGVLIAVWCVILTIWYTFKVPYVLVKTLISAYINIFTAPLQIIAGVFVPSSGFGSWLKKLFADILVFPVTGLLMWFAWYFLWNAGKQLGLSWARVFTTYKNLDYQDAWIPGIIGAKGLGMDADITTFLMLGISFGMIVLIPKVPDLLKSIFLGEKFAFGTAIGEATGAGKTAFGYLGGNVLQKGGSYAGASFSENVLKNISGNMKLPGFIRKPAGWGQKALQKSLEGSKNP